jgi:SH3 domain-containing YSC84-like protein 1
LSSQAWTRAFADWTDHSPAATAAEARKIVENATSIVQKMTSDDRLSSLLKQSKGVFILPNVLKGGLIVGGRGGEGVLLTREEGAWSNPAFFGLAAITVGAQAGGAVGPVVMLLKSEEAVRSFTQEDDFALDASAGLSVFGYDVADRTDTRAGDVIVWSDRGGAFAGATIGASDISIDDEKNHAYCRRPTSLASILAGEVENPHLKLLQEELPAGE